MRKPHTNTFILKCRNFREPSPHRDLRPRLGPTKTARGEEPEKLPAFLGFFLFQRIIKTSGFFRIPPSASLLTQAPSSAEFTLISI